MNMENHLDPQQARRLLDEIASLAEHCSLTGSLEGGRESAIRRYNLVLASLAAQGELRPGFFEPLGDEVSFDRLGVEARLLRGTINGDGRESGSRCSRGEGSLLIRLAPFLDQEDLTRLVRVQLDSGAKIDEHLITALAPFLEGHALHDLVEQLIAKGAGGRTARETHCAHPAPEEPVRVEHHPVPVMGDLDRVEDLNDRMKELVNRLGQPGLCEADRAALAAELVRVGFEHGQATRS
ncbi:MAG TPA: hypothetical protein PLH94_00985 [Fimbriimonadaceae bacterium]|nr:hypothetical protein [Fimbriimonadaceae bacterium]